MTDLFVFTASNPDAQRHWAKSIAQPVNPALVFDNFSSELHGELEAIRQNVGNFYCWGATPGENNIPNWERLQTGDFLLGYFHKSFRCITSAVAKYHNLEFARRLWGLNDEKQTWEYMYFLTHPTYISVLLEEFADIFGGGYQGFAHVSDDKIQTIVETYGSIENFVEQRLGVGNVSPENPIAPPQPTPPPPAKPNIEDEITKISKEQNQAGVFQPDNQEDARERTIRSIVIRRGQPDFRRKLLLAYGEQCAITQFDSPTALEAAHIAPYKGDHTNHVTNGLLLRSDIHTLFDCGLLAINTSDMTVVISPELIGTRYEFLRARELHLPLSQNDRPNIEALNDHRLRTGI